MKSIAVLLFLATPCVLADEIRNLRIGSAEIVYDHQTTETGVAILTLAAVVAETNNSLRGLKNTDQRRLSKLGQLIYQCKLMLYKPAQGGRAPGVKDPVLVSRNYSLFTGVNLSLAADERAGIRAQALRAIDDASLFTPALGGGDTQKEIWQTVGEGSAINLRQFNVNILKETDLIETSASIDINVRFPVFQLEKPVFQWNYNFDLKDFRQAVRHIDDNCTPARFGELIKQKT
jgi:hypothetical protein